MSEKSNGQNGILQDPAFAPRASARQAAGASLATRPPMRVFGVIVFGVVLLAFSAAATVRAGQFLEYEKRIRATDPALRLLIRDVMTASPTFHRLVARLEHSDVIVYVTRQYDMPVMLEGQVTFMAQAGGVRYLNIRLAWDRPPRRLVATLAHELQHAVEIANLPEVVDDKSLARAYARIGEPANWSPGGVLAFDTKAAGAIEQKVWREYEPSSADD
jgi:hypothetical protein